MKAELIKARGLIEDPAAWMKGAMRARRTGPNGFQFVGVDQQADCFCLLGAIFEACGDTKVGLKIAAHVEVTTGKQLPHDNDSPRTTHADVMGWLDAAIEAAP